MSHTSLTTSQQDYSADIQTVLDRIIRKITGKSVDPCEYFKDEIDQCVLNINSVGLGRRRDRVFQDKVDIGNYLLSLNEKCEQEYFEWTPVLKKVSGDTGDDVRQLQRYMKVAREKDLDKKYYSRGFTTVENYIAATRGVDENLGINLVLENIEKDDAKEDRRRIEATKVASKLMVDEKYSEEFESKDIDNIKSIISSKSGVNYEKIVDDYRDTPEDERDEYTDEIVLSGGSISVKETSEYEENIGSILSRVKSDLKTVIDSEQDLSDIHRDMLNEINMHLGCCLVK